jgi:hypothetical protein
MTKKNNVKKKAQGSLNVLLLAIGAIVVVSVVLVLVVKIGAQSRDGVIEDSERRQRAADLFLPPTILSYSPELSYCIVKDNEAYLLFFWKPMSEGTHKAYFSDNRGNFLNIKKNEPNRFAIYCLTEALICT